MKTNHKTSFKIENIFVFKKPQANPKMEFSPVTSSENAYI